MASYRYIAVDLLTHTKLAELPLTGVRWGQRLNRAGPLSAVLKMPAGAAGATLAAIYVDATDPLRRAVYVERDGRLMWGGPWWTRDYDPATQSLSLGGFEWWSLFSKRRIGVTKTYSSATDDQLAIVRDLVAYSQAKPGGDLGITLDATVSGIKRDRTYWFYEAKIVADAVQEMADNVGGFDFAIDVAYSSAGAFLRTLNLGYPRRGRIAGNTGHVWELGRNMVGFGWPEDGARGANMIFGIGAGEGDAMLRANASHPAQWSAGYPLLEDAFTDKTISVATTLAERVNQKLNDLDTPVVLPPIKVRGDIEPEVGSFIAGDEGRVRIQPNTDPRFPNGLDTYRRIVAYDVDVPDEGGGENVTLTLDQAVGS